MKTHVKKIFRDIGSRKGRSLLVILSIAIGVFGVSTMLGITDLVNRQLDADVKSSQISHTHVYVVSNAGQISVAENETYLDEVRQLPGVVDVEGQAVYPLKWQLSGEDTLHNGFIIAFSEPMDKGDLETISRKTAGRYPEAGEVAVSQIFADKYDIELGDKLVFPNNTGAETFTVVGFVLHPYWTFSSASDNVVDTAEAIYANYEDAQHIVNFAGFSAIHVRYENTDLSIDELTPLMEAISTKTPYVPVYTNQDDPENDFLSMMMGEMLGSLDMLGILAMVVSGFLVTNVMNTIVMEQRQQIGTMKSLGATFKDNVLIYGGMALVYGLIGTILGLLISIPVAAYGAKPVAIWASVYIDGIKLSPVGLGVGAIMGIIVPILASIPPLLSSMRITILSAFTDLGLVSSWGHTGLSRWIGKIPLPTAVRQGINNIWLKKWRLTLTGMALTMAVAAFMSSTAVAKSMDDVVDEGFGVYGYQIRVSPQQAQDYDTLTDLIMSNNDQIAAVYPGFNISVMLDGFSSEMMFAEGSNQVAASGFDPSTPTFDYQLIEGDAWENDPTRDGVLISKSLAENIDKHVGDMVLLEINGHEQSYPIIGITDYFFDALYMNWQELANLAGYIDAEGNPVPGTYYLVMHNEDATVEEVDSVINDLEKLLISHEISATYVNQPKAAQTMSEEVGILGQMFSLMSIVMATVGVVGLMATLTMAVFERQKEIGVMRSIGAPSRSILGQFMLEGILISLIAWLIAIPLSFALGIGLLSVLPFDFVEFNYPPELIVYGLVSIVIIAGLASLWPSLSASRKTVSDILRYE